MIVVGLAVAGGCLLVYLTALVFHERARIADDLTKVPVVGFELAGTGRRTFELLTAIGASGRACMRRAIGIDRWIILGYAPGLAVLSLLSIRVVHDAADGAIETIGVVLAAGMAAAAVAAGLLDLVENAKLIEILDGWSDPQPGADERGTELAAAHQQHRRALIARFERPSSIARRAATTKFVLVGLVVLGWGTTVLTITLA